MIYPERQRKRKIYFVFGVNGTGKSYLIKNSLLKQFRNKIIIDTQFEYDKHGKVFHEAAAALMFIYMALEEKFNFNVVFQNDDLVENEIFLQSLSEIYDSTLVIDEIYQFMKPGSEHPILNRWLNTGRHKRINIIAASRRPAQVSRLSTSQADKIYYFRLTETVDLRYVSERHSKDFSKQVAGLPNHRYLLKKM